VSSYSKYETDAFQELLVEDEYLYDDDKRTLLEWKNTTKKGLEFVFKYQWNQDGTLASLDKQYFNNSSVETFTSYKYLSRLHRRESVFSKPLDGSPANTIREYIVDDQLGHDLPKKTNIFELRDSGKYFLWISVDYHFERLNSHAIFQNAETRMFSSKTSPAGNELSSLEILRHWYRDMAVPLGNGSKPTFVPVSLFPNPCAAGALIALEVPEEYSEVQLQWMPIQGGAPLMNALKVNGYVLAPSQGGVYLLVIYNKDKVLNMLRVIVQ
jgi:hypothetical protein